MEFNPQNILINNFGQIGDVILSLPALKAVREKFPQARITVLVGKSAAQILEIVDFIDERIVVDRVKLLHSNPAWSVWQILKIMVDVRRRRFDFVIDLHSLYETNILGLLSGAKTRLYAKREARSLDWLSNFKPEPPPLDISIHYADSCLAVLKPLGIENAPRFLQLDFRTKYSEKINSILRARGAENKNLIGFFPGAGNPQRRWSLDNFARLAALLEREENSQVIIFLGPEEKSLRSAVETKFSGREIIVDDLTLLEFAAALSHLQVLVSNDTSAIHIGSLAGTGIVLLSRKGAQKRFLPLNEKSLALDSKPLDEITVEEVFVAIKKLQTRGSSENKLSEQYQTQSS